MSDLKPCPFCGSSNVATEKSLDLAYCDNCSAESNIEHWNARPIEDALNARIAELSQAVGLITTLKPTMVMDANHPLDMVREVAEHVTTRIAELEAENNRLAELLHNETHYNDAVSAGKVSVDVKRDLSDAEIEELGAQEAEKRGEK